MRRSSYTSHTVALQVTVNRNRRIIEILLHVVIILSDNYRFSKCCRFLCRLRFQQTGLIRGEGAVGKWETIAVR